MKQVHRLRTRMLALFCVILLLAGSAAVASDIETLMLIESAERKFTSAEFGVKRQIFDSKEKNSNLRASYEAEVSIEYGTVQKYKIDTKSNLPVQGGGQSDNWFTAAFNGDTESAIRYGIEFKPQCGLIRPDADKESFDSVNFAGARYFLPMFEKEGLTAYLKNIPSSFPEWTIIDPIGDDNKLTIWAPAYLMDPEQKYHECFEATLDFSRGGNIVSMTFYQNCGTPKEFVFRRVSVEEFKEIDGIFVPSVIEIDQSGEYSNAYFDWRRINFTPDEADFRLEFPDGLTVIDERFGRREMKYVTGLVSSALGYLGLDS